MENDSNPHTERHEGSSLAGAHSTAVSQQAQTAWSSVWEQRASAKDAEFVRRCCAECASGPGHPRPLPIGRLSGALRASASCEQNRHIGDATPKSFHQRRLAARSPSPRAREPSGGAPTPLYPTSEFREPPWLDGLALSRAYVFCAGASDKIVVNPFEPLMNGRQRSFRHREHTIQSFRPLGQNPATPENVLILAAELRAVRARRSKVVQPS
jgi:hypothetical protein